MVFPPQNVDFEEVRDFLSYQPCPELLDAVTKLKEGSWQGLELKCARRSFEATSKPRFHSKSLSHPLKTFQNPFKII